MDAMSHPYKTSVNTKIGAGGQWHIMSTDGILDSVEIHQRGTAH